MRPGRTTDAAGAVTSSTVVDPWGGEAAGRWALNTSQQRRKYTTYERDADGGDEAMRRRYSAWWARFSQPDPYDGSYDLTDPQSLNRYAYAQNDPVNLADPTGMFAVLTRRQRVMSYGEEGIWPTGREVCWLAGRLSPQPGP